MNLQAGHERMVAGPEGSPGRPPPLRIAGAGPAGLSAALAAARAGRGVEVLERRAGVGLRFHGDYQGLENWTTEGDVLEELAALGIATDFDHAPVRELVLFDPWGHEAVCRAAQPLFYLVQRGPAPGTLDHALQRQAQAEGVTIRFRRPVPPGGADLMAVGPRRSNVIAIGYLFDTDMADGVYAAVSDRLAPKGYAYLLVSRGRGTLAVCLFDAFERRRECLERSVEFFSRRAGLRMHRPRAFGGLGSVGGGIVSQAGGTLLAGEAAGFQDALFGFGIRYALLSGHLAGRALAGGGAGYEDAWRRRLGGQLAASRVNRLLYARGGRLGYAYLVRRVSRTRDPRGWLRRFYAPSAAKSWLLPLARPPAPLGGGRGVAAGPA